MGIFPYGFYFLGLWVTVSLDHCHLIFASVLFWSPFLFISSAEALIIHTFILFKVLSLFFVRGGAEVRTQGFKLARQALNHVSHASSPFCLLVF
jgi:hypothetical protein